GPVGHGAERRQARDQLLDRRGVRRLADQHVPAGPGFDADVEDGGARVEPTLRAHVLDRATQRVHGPSWTVGPRPALRRAALRRRADAAAADAATAACAR